MIGGIFGDPISKIVPLSASILEFVQWNGAFVGVWTNGKFKIDGAAGGGRRAAGGGRRGDGRGGD
ncbi:hypothetical protein, partial [Mangrovihabitans endophyticus]|uniref:hypothetical protein n=1 Tax=Mangrovihabitans endophyticus TaxID=1751298 RepID=UPI001E5407D7